MKLKVWFNEGSAVIAEAIQSICLRERTLPCYERVVQKIHVSHRNRNFIGFSSSGELEILHAIEPSSITPKAYVDWALRYAGEHGIDCIVVSRFYSAMIERREEFRTLGVALLYSCSPKELRVIDVKAEFYHRLEQAFYGDMVPAWLIWNDNYETQLAQSVAIIKSRMVAVPEDLKAVCAKPSDRHLGRAFYTFNADPDPRQQLFSPEDKIMRYPEFGELAHRASLKAGAANDWLVMELLPGHEYSVDCLAWEGQLITHVARQKPEDETDGELIIDSPEIERQVKILAREFGFSGMFNCRFRLDSEGRYKVLGANPRFSEGLGMSMLCGVNLPWLWLKLHATNGEGLEALSASKLHKAEVGRRLFSWSKPVILHKVSEQEPALCASKVVNP